MEGCGGVAIRGLETMGLKWVGPDSFQDAKREQLRSERDKAREEALREKARYCVCVCVLCVVCVVCVCVHLCK